MLRADNTGPVIINKVTLSNSCGVTISFDDSIGKRLWRFLGQIVPDTAADDPVCLLAGELARIGAWWQVRCTVGITFERDGGRRDHRALSEAMLQLVVFRFAFCKALPPAIIVDDDGDMVGVVECCGDSSSIKIYNQQGWRLKF